MHPHTRTLILFMLIGLLCGAFSATSVFLMNNSTATTSRHISTKPTPTSTPTPTSEPDFCINVPVLTYHHIQPFEIADPKNQRELTVTPENFDWHIQLLKSKGYRFIKLEELVEALRTKTPFEDKVIAITLDDAYVDAYTYAFPIAKLHQIPVNIGVITGLVGNPEHLTASQIRTMQKSGLISFHNHSWSHMNLSSLPLATVQQQILRPQDHLESWIGTPSAILIYPYGVSGPTVRRALKNGYFDAAFELSLKIKSTEQCLSKIYQLPRLRIGNAGPGAYDL